jgi:hypothetical protein
MGRRYCQRDMNKAAYKEESLRRTAIHLAALIIVSMWARTASAQITPAAGFTPPDDTPSIKVGTTIFTNYTYTNEPKGTDADKNTINPNSFEVGRAYINVTGNISHLVSFRVTPDIAGRFSTTVSSKSTVAGGATGETVTTTTTGSTSYDGNLVFRLKYAFGQLNLDEWTTKGTWLRLGQQQTPYIDFIEGIYRYRFQGTVFMERSGYGSSADVGFSGHYAIVNDYGDLHVGIYNGDTYSKAEPNDQKGIEGRFTLRPLARMATWKGLRLTAFFKSDHYIANSPRNRFLAAATFEHKNVNLGLEYLNATDKANAAGAQVKGNGFSFWATPRTNVGLEGLFRYDSLKPNKDVDAKRNITIVGLSYWFRTTAKPAAAAILADYEHVTYDAQPSGAVASPVTTVGKPTETRYALHALFNF